MADTDYILGTPTAFTLTSANLASSATAGWKSNVITKSADHVVDVLISVELAAVNTAPASSKGIFLFAYGAAVAGGAYTSSGDGTPDGNEGTITFPDVTSNVGIPMPRLGFIPYTVQNKAINSEQFSLAIPFKGIILPKWGICMVNHSGMTLNVTTIKYTEVFGSVV